MALKALLLRKQLDDKKKALEDLRAKDQELQTREAELETAIGEAESEEDKAAVEGLVNEFEQDKQAHEENKTKLAGEVEQLEQDLAAEEAKQTPPADPAPAPDNNPGGTGERKDDNIMSMKRRGFFGLDRQQRDAFLAREEVKDFLQRVRALGKEKRGVTGAELTIPTVVLDLIRENISRYSKLIAHVRLRAVPGKARQHILGAIPEAIWTEACGTLNELDLSIGQVEVDGYKVGGLIAICNATLEDSDLNLSSEIMDALGQAIGYAVDKAIVYGTGNKMPLGFVTRLAQTAKPSDWDSNAPAWKDLHTSNVVTITGKTGIALYQEMIRVSSKAKSTYAREGLTWIMNESTKANLTAEGLAVNAAGAIVSGINNTMPVAGGDIVTLDFMANGDIAFGFGELYLLVERAGAQLAQSEHARFAEDQTLFKGTARYDGMPVFGEAFGIMNINGETPTTSVTFPPDTANAAAAKKAAARKA